MIVLGCVLVAVLVAAMVTLLCMYDQKIPECETLPVCTETPVVHTFQHSQFPITEQTFRKVTEVRHQLLKGVVSALEDEEIRYVLTGGNLLEFTRGKKIVQDDDLDLRIHRADLNKWMRYCRVAQTDQVRNLDLTDGRRLSVDQQRFNGFQVGLLHYDETLKEVEPVQVHADVVASVVGTDFWPDVDYLFSQPRRRVNYLGVEVMLPSVELTRKYLTRVYGKNYLVPAPVYSFSFDPNRTPPR